MIILFFVTYTALNPEHTHTYTSTSAPLPRAQGTENLPVTVPIPPGSLWGSAVRGGELSACPTKSPFRDMNLNKVGDEEEVGADACCCYSMCVVFVYASVYVCDRWGVAEC